MAINGISVLLCQIILGNSQVLTVSGSRLYAMQVCEVIHQWQLQSRGTVLCVQRKHNKGYITYFLRWRGGGFGGLSFYLTLSLGGGGAIIFETASGEGSYLFGLI